MILSEIELGNNFKGLIINRSGLAKLRSGIPESTFLQPFPFSDLYIALGSSFISLSSLNVFSIHFLGFGLIRIVGKRLITVFVNSFSYLLAQTPASTHLSMGLSQIGKQAYL